MAIFDIMELFFAKYLGGRYELNPEIIKHSSIRLPVGAELLPEINFKKEKN